MSRSVRRAAAPGKPPAHFALVMPPAPLPHPSPRATPRAPRPAATRAADNAYFCLARARDITKGNGRARSRMLHSHTWRRRTSLAQYGAVLHSTTQYGAVRRRHARAYCSD
ncbi:unnamed protein product [Euphydryas editha]|uniref:Uncharacterized protein n=1 Tax=Euphydryas editha TaxID=104508 RepID=A0AAU9TXG6_EUPED|nr:unnamed protein product [Euphydryas editha]